MLNWKRCGLGSPEYSVQKCLGYYSSKDGIEQNGQSVTLLLSYGAKLSLCPVDLLD